MTPMLYPRPISSIHQIEITSRCNLRCVYCPSPHLETKYGRDKVDMGLSTYRRALKWAMHFEDKGTQGELALTGVGEPTLHPEFVQMVRLAREALPHNRITFSTNGLLLDEAMCEALAPYRPEIYVSLHRPEKAKHAIDAAKKHGLLAATNTAFATEAFDWAGSLDWAVSIPDGAVTCEFLKTGWSVVLSDGRITTCCLDAAGDGVVGHVGDEIGSLSLEPWSGKWFRQGTGCKSCHMAVP